MLERGRCSENLSSNGPGVKIAGATYRIDRACVTVDVTLVFGIYDPAVELRDELKSYLPEHNEERHVSSHKALLAALFVTVASTTSWADPRPFDIVVTRDSVNGCLVTGTISVNGKQLGPAYGNTQHLIPAGKYTAQLKYVSAKHAAPGPFGTIATSGDFIVQLNDVNDAANLPWTGILLHPGNRPEHSDGCILLGPVERWVSNGKIMGSFLAEDNALRQLRIEFYDGEDIPDATPNKLITVLVVDKVSPPVFSVRLNATTLTLSRGQAFNLVPDLRDAANNSLVLRSRQITYVSSNPGVASVSAGGVMRAGAIGGAQITATSEGKSAQVAVTVLNPNPAGWYGFAGVHADRESELQHITGGFRRAPGAGNFANLCASINRVCGRVIDWQNHPQSCSAPPDGTRLAFCQ
jgi:hypothetical protein